MLKSGTRVLVSLMVLSGALLVDFAGSAAAYGPSTRSNRAPVVVHSFGTNSNIRLNLNWAGYAAVATKREFWGSAGIWSVPQVTCTPGENSNSSMWTGIGGTTAALGNILYQTGTRSNCVSGNPQYYAWWEAYPINTEQAYGSSSRPDVVHPGDRMETMIINNHYYGPSTTVSMKITDYAPDGTQNWTETSTIGAPRFSSSAECIVERPGVGGAFGNLPNFGTAVFDSCYGCYDKSASVQGCEDTSTTYTTPGAKVFEYRMTDAQLNLMAVPAELPIPPGSQSAPFEVVFKRTN